MTAQSTLKAWPSRLTTTSAPPPRSKYLPMLVESSSETRVRRASPTSTCLPVTWTCMGRSTRPAAGRCQAPASEARAHACSNAGRSDVSGERQDRRAGGGERVADQRQQRRRAGSAPGDRAPTAAAGSMLPSGIGRISTSDKQGADQADQPVADAAEQEASRGPRDRLHPPQPRAASARRRCRRSRDRRCGGHDLRGSQGARPAERQLRRQQHQRQAEDGRWRRAAAAGRRPGRRRTAAAPKRAAAEARRSARRR